MSNLPETQESKDLTIEPKFVPTPAMLVWLDASVELVDASPSAIEEYCKVNKSPVSRQSWYAWLKLPGFENWYWEAYKNHRRRWMPKLDQIGMMMAKRDYDYWAAMNKKAGEDLDNKTPANLIQNNMKIEFD